MAASELRINDGPFYQLENAPELINVLIRWIRQQPGYELVPIIPVAEEYVVRAISEAEKSTANLLVIRSRDYKGLINLVYSLQESPAQPRPL